MPTTARHHLSTAPTTADTRLAGLADALRTAALRGAVLCGYRSLAPRLLPAPCGTDSGTRAFRVRGSELATRWASWQLSTGRCRWCDDDDRRRLQEAAPAQRVARSRRLQGDGEDGEAVNDDVYFVYNSYQPAYDDARLLFWSRSGESLLVPERLEFMLAVEAAVQDYSGDSSTPYPSPLPSDTDDTPPAQGAVIPQSIVQLFADAVAGLPDARPIEELLSDPSIESQLDRYASPCNQSVIAISERMEYAFSSWEEERALRAWQKGLYEMIIDDFGSDDHIEVVFHDWDRFDEEFEEALLSDGMLCVGVLVVVYLFTYFHTESLFVTLASGLEATLTFPVAYFIYRGILGIEYIGSLQFLSMFVIAAIAADDTFVLVDAWKQSLTAVGARGDADAADMVELRMRWTLSQAGHSMFVTSFTSAAAFFSNLISSIPPLRLFGLITGLSECCRSRRGCPSLAHTDGAIRGSGAA